MTVLFRDLRFYGYCAYTSEHPNPYSHLLTLVRISYCDSTFRSGARDIRLLCVYISTKPAPYVVTFINMDCG
jgi:hypothetical protein